MATTLQEFHSLVSETLNRGSQLDARIPTQVRLAVRWLERNYTFKYMEKFRLLQLEPGDRTLEMPVETPIKGFKFVRLVNSDKSYTYVKKLQPEDMGNLAEEITGYWLVGLHTIVFNAVPQAQLHGEAMWWQYTQWPELPASEHPLLDVGEDVLLAQTLLFMSAFVTRDARMLQGWKAVRDEGINTLTRAEDEVRYGSDDLTLNYRPYAI